MARYKSIHTGPQIDSGVARALPGGEIDQLRPNRNLLDNWDFRNPVNQRGQTSYRGAGYCIDMWKLNGTNTATIVDGGVKFGHVDNNYVADQPLEDIVDGVYTLSVLFGDNTLKYVTCEVANGKGTGETQAYRGWIPRVDEKFFRLIHLGNDAFEITIKAVKLELGSVSTLANDPPADYGIELLKCQRYFQTFKTQPLRPTDYRDFRPIMRTNPVLSTITVGADTLYTASADL